jgi:hypothetical protein
MTVARETRPPSERPEAPSQTIELGEATLARIRAMLTEAVDRLATRLENGPDGLHTNSARHTRGRSRHAEPPEPPSATELAGEQARLAVTRGRRPRYQLITIADVPWTPGNPLGLSWSVEGVPDVSGHASSTADAAKDARAAVAAALAIGADAFDLDIADGA